MPHQVDQLPVVIQSRILHKLDKASKPKPQHKHKHKHKHTHEHEHEHGGTTHPVEEVHVAAPYADRSTCVTEGVNKKEAPRPPLQQHGRHRIDVPDFCVRLKILDNPNQARDSHIGPGKPGVSTAAPEMPGGTHTADMGKIDLEYGLGPGAPGRAALEPDLRAFEQPRDEEALLQLENDQAWRRLLADTWAAVAADHGATHLSMRALVPVWSSAFHTPRFGRFLSRLEGLEIGVAGMRNGHRAINTVPAYNDSLQSLLKAYFLRASSVRRLSLHASQQAPLGARGNYHIPLSLKATQLPALEHLSLKNCFAGFELAHFINGHARALRSVELHNCYAFRGGGGGAHACDQGPGAGGMQWARFFSLINRPGMALSRLVISDDYIPLTIDDPRLGDYDPDTADEPADVKNVRRAQRRDPGKRLFLYAYLRDYSGELWMNKDAIVGAFESGDDQLAYDELMARIEGNAASQAVEVEDCPAVISEG